MGNFLALSGVIARSSDEVLASLTKYSKSVGGGIVPDNTLNSDDVNCCIVNEQNGNTTILYPYGFSEWDETSEFISRELNATVFSLHIHDSDLWMYLLYNNGEIVDQFNPVPDYWDKNITDEEFERWKGNASIVTQYISYVKSEDIDKYLVLWDIDEDEDENTKAYPTDEFGKEEWQLLDFMTKLRLEYPLDDNNKPKGQLYRLWTNKLGLELVDRNVLNKSESKAKPWWKFW